jgi:hypothetical protein
MSIEDESPVDKGNKPAHIQAYIERKIINKAIKLKKTETTE